MDCSAVTAEDVCILTDLKSGRRDYRSENHVVTVSPSKLKFAFNSLLTRTAPITIWNKTKESVRFRILQPQTDIFQVYCNQSHVFPNSEVTLYVKCRPRNIQICVDCLEIQVRDQDGIRVPLEVLPNVDWFALPKFLTLPLASLNQRIETKISLPLPHGSKAYEFCIASPVSPYFGVQPRCGKMGGPDGVTFLIVSFKSHEYITLTYKLQIKFPGIDGPPYEINVFGRCVPNLENEEIRKDVATVETCASEITEKKDPKPKDPRFRLHGCKKNDKLHPSDSETKELDLFTPGGVMKFLIQNSKSSYDPYSILGPMGVPTAQSQAVYSQKLQDFHNKVIKADIQQANLSFQHSKERIGADSNDLYPEKLRELRLQQEGMEQEYAKAVGIEPSDPEDLTRAKLKTCNQRPIRPAGAFAAPKFGVGANFTDESFLKDRYRVKRAILQPFIQAARKFITAWRVDQRLKKLAALKKEMSEFRQYDTPDETTNNNNPKTYDCYGPRGEYPTSKDYRIAQVLEKLRAKELKHQLDHIQSHLEKLNNKLNNDLEQIPTTIQANTLPNNSDYETAEEEDDEYEPSTRSKPPTLDLQLYFERINESINRLQHKIKNEDISTELRQILKLMDFSSPEESAQKFSDKRHNVSFTQMALLMKKVNDSINDLQKIIANPVLNVAQHKINSIADSLKIIGKPVKNYFSGKYNKNLTPGIPYPSPFELEKHQILINEAFNNLNGKLRNTLISDLQEGINAEINSLKGYPSSFEASSYSGDTLCDDIEPEDVKALLNEVNIDLERLQNRIGSQEIDHFHSTANSEVAGFLNIQPYETNFSRKQGEAFRKAQNLSTDELLNHLKRINEEINELAKFQLDYDNISVERLKINHEILGYIEIRGKHPNSVNHVIPPSHPRLASPSELKLHHDSINQEISALQTKINNPVITSSQNRINSIFEKHLNRCEVDSTELRHLREKINAEMNVLQHLANHSIAIEEELNKFNNELNRFLPPASTISSNIAEIHDIMAKLNQELDQLQIFLRCPKINITQLDTNITVDDLLDLRSEERFSSKYAAKQNEMKHQGSIEIPVKQLQDHQSRINSEFRNLLENVKDPKIKTYQKIINDEINKVVTNYLRDKPCPTKEEIKSQLKRIEKGIGNLQKIIQTPVLSKTVSNISKILAKIIGEPIEAPKVSYADEELYTYQKKINLEIDKLKEKVSDECADILEKSQQKINEEVDKISGRRSTRKSIIKPKANKPFTNQELLKHKKNINRAIENLLEKIQNPVLEANKEEISAVIDGLMVAPGATVDTSRGSGENRLKLLDKEQKINYEISHLFDLSTHESRHNMLKQLEESASDLEKRMISQKQPITADELAFYQNQLNEQYAKILDRQPNLGVYKNQISMNELLDGKRLLTSGDEKFKPKPLFEHFQKPNPLNLKELKRIRRNYNLIASDIQSKLRSKDLEKVQKEFNDLLDLLIVSQGGSLSLLDDDGPEIDPDYLKSRMKSIDSEMQSLSELLPGEGVDNVREGFHKEMVDLIKSKDPSYDDKGIAKTLRHTKSLEDVDRKLVEDLRRHLNIQFGELIQNTLDPDIAKLHRDLNRMLENLMDPGHGKGPEKVALPPGHLKNLKVVSETADPNFTHSSAAHSTQVPRFPDTTEGHEVLVGELIKHQEEMNNYFNNLQEKESVDKIAEKQDQFNKEVAGLLAIQNVSEIFTEDEDTQAIKNIQKVGQIVQNMHRALANDSALANIASGISQEVARITPGTSKSSFSSASTFNDITPKELEKRRKKITKYLKETPKTMISPEMKEHLDELDSWFDNEKQNRTSGYLNNVLPEINRQIDTLQDRVENQDVADLQESLNSELYDLLDLPIDEGLRKRIRERPFRSSRKIPKDVTSDVLKAHKKSINGVIDSLPPGYKTKGVQNIQKSLDNKINYLQDRIRLNQGLAYVEIYDKEIEALQDSIMNGDVGKIHDKLHEEFTNILKLPSQHWKSFKDKSFNTEIFLPPLHSSELSRRRNQISKAFRNIPGKFRSPHVNNLHAALINIILGLEKKMANESKRALQDELSHEISDLQAKISGEIRNIRNNIFAEVQDLESDSHLDSSKIEKAQRKIHLEILGVKDRISFEVEKLYNLVKSYKNLKNKKKHLNAIENLHGVTEKGISTLMNEVINLLNALRSKLGLRLQLPRRPKKGKLRAGAKKILNPIAQSKTPRFLRICKTSSSPSVSLQTSTTTVQSLPRHRKVCYYVKADDYMPTEKASVIGISLPNSDTRLITPIPSFIDKQKLQDATKSSRCAFNLSSRSAEKLIQELRRIGNS